MTAHMRTVGSRRLAIELKRFRDNADLTGEQVAEEMGWSVAKVYRIEGDKVRVLPRDVARLLKLYGVEGAERDAVMELAKLARGKDWWHQYSGAIPEWFQFYVGLETAASALRGYESELVPGLFQTEAYARAIMSTAPAADNEEADRQITVRMERQKRLTASDPLTVWQVLNEAVIRRPVGGADVMRAQLDHLIEVASLKNVTLQILSFDKGAHPAMIGSFQMMEFPDPADPEVVYLETQTGALYVEKQQDVREYGLRFDYARAQALGPAESRAMLIQLASESP
ncbi:MAG TPA: helix-turn-helix transcriptional regulator [Streptosporangiaceae bacterium]